MVRVLTALGIMAVCGLAIYRGWNTADFLRVEASPAGSHGQSDTLSSWLAFPGVADLAAASSLTAVTDPNDRESQRRRAAGLAAFLAPRPAASAAWLSVPAVRRI